MIGAERAPLAEQLMFVGNGDLAFAECTPEYARQFSERVKREALWALENDNRFRDGSVLEGANLSYARSIALQQPIDQTGGGAEHVSLKIDRKIKYAREGPVQPVVLNLYEDPPAHVLQTVEVDVPVNAFRYRRESYQFDQYIDPHRRRRVFIPRRVG